MNKYNLSSSLGQISVYIIYIMGIELLGFLTYSIIVNNIDGTIACLLFIVFFYFAFLRKVLKFKKITFDSKSIYIGDECISLRDVESLQTGEIILQKNGNQEKIIYNSFFCDNLKILKGFYEVEREF